jgi:hypothetical protein
MAPKRSCKGKKHSKKCSHRSSRKRSCPKKPSLFMDDIRWMKFKKAAQESAQAAYKRVKSSSDEDNKIFEKKSEEQKQAWEIFYKSVNPRYITQKFLDDAKNELTLALVPLFTSTPVVNANYYPYNIIKIINALESLTTFEIDK